MRALSLIVLAAFTWGTVATADVTLTNNFGGGLVSINALGYTDFGGPPPGRPSIISVDPSGWGGAVTSLSVSLLGLDYSSPEDLEVWVANPGAEGCWLMGNTGYFSGSPVDLAFSDSAAGPVLPSVPLSSGTFLPSAPGGLLLPPDAPDAPTPAEVFLTDLIDPSSTISGDWLLFVYSDYADDGTFGGDLAGWSLTFGIASGGGGGGDGGGPGSNPSTPEPSALLLSLAALAGLAVRRPRRR